MLWRRSARKLESPGRVRSALSPRVTKPSWRCRGCRVVKRSSAAAAAARRVEVAEGEVSLLVVPGPVEAEEVEEVVVASEEEEMEMVVVETVVFDPITTTEEPSQETIQTLTMALHVMLVEVRDTMPQSVQSQTHQ